MEEFMRFKKAPRISRWVIVCDVLAFLVMFVYFCIEHEEWRAAATKQLKRESPDRIGWPIR